MATNVSTRSAPGVRPASPATAARRGKQGVIVITGSSGFLGRAMIEALHERFDIVGLDFELPSAAHPNYEAVRVDLSSDRSVKAALHRVRAAHGGEIAAVIHLAAYYDLSGEPSGMYERVTVKGTERLLAALQSFDVDQFILASTMLVHAPAEPGRKIDENAAVAPQSPYPQSKVDAERAAIAAHGQMPLVILRLAGVYDDTCRAAFLAEQIAAIFERRFTSRVFPGELDRGQPYLHVDDLVDAIKSLVDRRKRLSGETTLLLSEPDTPSYGLLQARIGELLHGEAWATREIPKPVAAAGQFLQEQVLELDPFVQPWMIKQAGDHYEIDIARAREVLDWRPRHRLIDTLPVMLAELKRDPEAWYKANKLNPARVASASVAAQARRQSPPGRAALHAADTARIQAHLANLWAPLAIMGLGLWLIFSPGALGLFDAAASSNAPPPPSAGHPLPDAPVRSVLQGWSEIASGASVILFGALAMSRSFAWARWAAAAIGGWLLVAPLVFWSPSAAAFLNDTLVGALVIAFAVIAGIPPGIAAAAEADQTDTPAGWTYSPSTYVQRVPIVALALIGFLISRYLTAFQLGHIPAVWDPFFGAGTERVITSWASHAWIIPDAGLGAATYLIEALTGAIGDRRRWRTMPWLVFAFGLMIVPLGVVSIAFIMIQPTLIGTWCALCLVTAAITVILIPYSLDEIVATWQFLVQSRRAGRSLWRTFWMGGSLPGGGRDKHPGLTAPFGTVIKTFATGGVTFPATLVGAAAIGIVLMCTRLLFGSEGAMANSDHVIGCLVITIAVSAFAEVGRIARLLNAPLGAWLVAAPFLLEGETMVGMGASVVLGLALIGFSLPRGRLSTRSPGWSSASWKDCPALATRPNGGRSASKLSTSMAGASIS